MFDIGFSELLVVFVVGLLILGPERLPIAAKTVGLWVRKIRRSINSIQREINMQLDQEELQRKLTDNNQRIMNDTENQMLPLSKAEFEAEPQSSAEAEPSAEQKPSAEKATELSSKQLSEEKQPDENKPDTSTKETQPTAPLADK